MLKHIYFTLISTFIFGFISGVTLFLYNNTGKEGDGGLKTETDEIIIAARTYGGCERGGGCSSYRITDSGDYQYINRAIGESEMRYEGELNDKQQDVLLADVSETDFVRLQATQFIGTCPTERDGNAYRYDIEYKGERYLFDTCVQSLKTAPLFGVLETYFALFATEHGNE